MGNSSSKVAPHQRVEIEDLQGEIAHEKNARVNEGSKLFEANNKQSPSQLHELTSLKAKLLKLETQLEEAERDLVLYDAWYLESSSCCQGGEDDHDS